MSYVEHLSIMNLATQIQIHNPRVISETRKYELGFQLTVAIDFNDKQMLNGSLLKLRLHLYYKTGHYAYNTVQQQ